MAIYKSPFVLEGAGKSIGCPPITNQGAIPYTQKYIYSLNTAIRDLNSARFNKEVIKDLNAVKDRLDKVKDYLVLVELLNPDGTRTGFEPIGKLENILLDYSSLRNSIIN